MYFSRTLRRTLVAVALFSNAAYCGEYVQLAKGTVKGELAKSRDGRRYYSFTGVPFAKPPVGDLRFEAPEPVDPWNGTLNATNDGPPIMCIQQHEADSREDCLYVNVYTPSTDGKLPVMFWIHGGAFRFGHGGPGMYGADYFMDANVVLVAANSRLGYLSTEDDAIPGNYGTKDQVMALRWVRENVAEFGGDPGRVTIFGGSSGGVSVGYHLLSPMSKGLFHKAVLQSGTPLCRWSTSVPGVVRHRSQTVAKLAGCTGHTDLLKCLKTVPASFFADVHERFLEWLAYPSVLFAPVVERCDSGREAFLCRHQLYEFKQESFVPTIVGLNSAEGAMIVASLYNDTSLRYPEFYTDFNRLASILTSYQHYTLDVNEIGENVFRRYFPSGKIEDHSHSRTVQMITDGRYLHGVLDMALKLSAPVYFYLYDYQNEFSFNSLYGNLSKNLGITHGDELNSLFKMNTLNPRTLNALDAKVSRLMVDVWTKFATSTIPTIDGTENGVAWPTFHQRNHPVLHINSDRPIITSNPFEDSYKFWNSLPLLSHLNEVMSENARTSKRVIDEL